MDPSTLRIVYMGTPDFAVLPLERLLEAGWQVVGVVTAPDKPAGRGHRPQMSAVKQFAIGRGIPILQPERLRDEAFLGQLRDWQADLQVVVAFRMLPEVVWSMPRLGTFNLHASLLPQYRGAAPINHAIINGETLTGVTTFFLNQQIDTGALIRQVPVPILPTDDAGTLHDKLMHVGAQAVVDTVADIAAGQVHAVPQPSLPADQLKPAPKIFKDTCRIRWDRPAREVHNFVRGLSPYPAAWAEIDLTGTGQPVAVKVYQTEVVPFPEGQHPQPGTLITDHKTHLRIAANDAYVGLLALQLPGKRRLRTDELLRGLRPNLK